MEQLAKRALNLAGQINEVATKLGLNNSIENLKKLKKQSENTDFWQDNNNAQEVMRQVNKLEAKTELWLNLIESINEVSEMSELNDDSIKEELNDQLKDIENKFNSLKEELKLNGTYDDHDAIVSIYAGAGGTDAQDWTQMLVRMYLRWAEKSKIKVTVIEQNDGEEAGIKSITMEMSGNFVYGNLKSEHGVHRLVRLSPFNSDNLRQTSFAKVDVLPKIEKVDALEIDDKDIRVDVYRSGGHGGQSVNTTDSAVRITHIPTNITVAIQNERSQLQNKELAMTILKSRLAQLQVEQHAQKLSQLKGPSQSAEWGNQIRSYVLHPYKQVKDLRSGFESSDPDKVLDGDLDGLIEAYLEYSLESK